LTTFSWCNCFFNFLCSFVNSSWCDMMWVMGFALVLSRFGSFGIASICALAA
jgi:hypothetical protein